MPYTSEKPYQNPSSDDLRARIPGWGVDLDPADRPSFPQELRERPDTGAHWDFPDRQVEVVPRERSIEHKMLTPVFGTSAPLAGVSGVIRRLAYRRYSEGRAAHWLLLLGADRVDAFGSQARSLLTRHPDNLITETGIASELTRHGFTSRFGKNRADVRHFWIDPILIAAPAVLAGVAVYKIVRKAI